VAVDTRGDAPRILAVTSSSLEVFDLGTGMSAMVSLPAPYASMLLFEGPAPGDPSVRSRVALYGGPASIAFVELGDAPADVRGSFVLPLTFQPDAVVADATAGRLIVFESLGRGALELDAAASYGRQPISVVDLFDRSAISLDATSDLSHAVVSTGLRDMWVAGAGGYVSRFDLATEEQEELWLAQAPETLLPLFGEAERVLAFSALRDGSFTILERGAAPRVVAGAW
jgi:hypothetical protein